MAIEGSLIFINQSVITVDSYRAVIVRDRKGKNFPVNLFFALYSSVNFDNTSYGASYTISILSIYYIESRDAALHLVYKKRKVYSIDYDEKEDIIDTTDKRIELIKLLVYKCESPKFNREIRL